MANKITKNSCRRILSKANVTHPKLGVELCSIWDWAVRAWMLSLTPGNSPVKSNLKKWGLTATAQCNCGHGDETLLHQQLHCHLNLKSSNHSTRSTKRKLNELLKPFDDTTSSQRPDGLIEDAKPRHIYIIEVARTDDSLDSPLRAHDEKMFTYNSLLHAL